MKAHVKLICAGLLILAGAGFASGTNESPVVNQDMSTMFFRKALSEMVISWLTDGNDLAGAECDRLADSLLSLEEPDVSSYFIAAQVAWLREKPKKAIAILEDAIRKYPDERAPIPSPVRIVGRFWIGTIARYSGDMAKAKNVYETLLTIIARPGYIEGLDDKGGVMMICNLYLAEIESLHLKRNDLALARLEAIERIKKPAGQLVVGYDIYKGWAAYEHIRITKGKSQATQQLIMYPEMDFALMRAAEGQLMLCGISGSLLAYYPLSDKRDVIERALFDRVIKSAVSPIDRSLARLIYGNAYQDKACFAEAEEYYSALFEEDSYFSPVAGLGLAQCKKAQDKTIEAESILEQVRIKYPGYDSAVTKLKESWEKETP